MDSYEASRAVFSRIKSIDPENAHKIIGYILLKDQGEKEMIRLAFAPENLVHSVVSLAKSELGLSSNTSSATNCSSSSTSLFGLSIPVSSSSPNPPHPVSLTSPRLTHSSFNLSPPSVLSPSTLNNNNFQEQKLPFLELPSENPVFLDQPLEMALSPCCRSDSSPYPFGGSGSDLENRVNFHRRSCSVNDIHFGTDDSTSGFGYKPCLYFSKGFCKNGSTCKFLHGNGNGNGGFMNSGDYPSAIVEQYEELLRSKFAQQQRLAAARFMAQRSAAAELMLSEEIQRLNRPRMGRNEISEMGFGDSAPSRQIYLTFPADSTFKEEDVSHYFSMYGPVQDVRIPYQQRRMFGFVTFLFPETVKIILAKGNPHFVCDSRVLVKPYKEKGKLLDKKNHSDRSELDYKESFEMHVGPRMFQNNRETMRKKMEQDANWEEALDFQRKRLMNMQLLDLNNHHLLNQHDSFLEYHAEESQGNPIAYPLTEEPQQKVDASYDGGNGNKEDEPEIKAPENLKSPFASEKQTAFITKPVEADSCNGISTSTVQSCLHEIPRRC